MAMAMATGHSSIVIIIILSQEKKKRCNHKNKLGGYGWLQLLSCLERRQDIPACSTLTHSKSSVTLFGICVIQKVEIVASSSVSAQIPFPKDGLSLCQRLVERRVENKT